MGCEMNSKNSRASATVIFLSLLTACAQRSQPKPDTDTQLYSPRPESPIYPIREPVDTLPIEAHSATPKINRVSTLSTRSTSPQPHSPTTRSAGAPKTPTPAPLPSPGTSLHPAPAHAPQPLAQQGRKTLVVGDSLLEGALGATLAKSLSQNDNEACVLSVSGSRYDDWTKSTLKNRYGANQRYSKNGHSISPSYGRSLSRDEVSRMSLGSVLAAPSSIGCGDKNFDSLVVSLGANHGPTESVETYIDEVILIATQKNIPKEQIRFVLPPGKRGQPNYYREANQRAVAYLAKLGLATPYDSSDLAIPDSSFNKGSEDHFYGSAQEKLWGERLSQYLAPAIDAGTADSSKTDEHAPVGGST